MRVDQALKPAADNPLNALLERANQIKQLDQAIRRFLTPELQAHCQVINLHQGRLAIQVKNSTWANQLRFQKTDLLHYLRGFPDFSGITGIRVIIQQFETLLPDKPKPLPQKLGASALESLAALTETIQDPRLQHRLAQFLQHQKS